MITANIGSHFPASTFADKTSGKTSPVPILTSQDIQGRLIQQIEEIAKARIESIRREKTPIDDLDIFASNLADEITLSPGLESLFEALDKSADEETSTRIVSSIGINLILKIRDALIAKV